MKGFYLLLYAIALKTLLLSPFKYTKTDKSLITPPHKIDMQLNTSVSFRYLKYESIAVKDVFSSFLFLIDFFYIYIYCSKFNAEFNKLIQTVGYHARLFEK